MVTEREGIRRASQGKERVCVNAVFREGGLVWVEQELKLGSGQVMRARLHSEDCRSTVMVQARPVWRKV